MLIQNRNDLVSFITPRRSFSRYLQLQTVGKFILNDKNHNYLAESEDKGEKGQAKAKRSRSKSRSRRNSTLTATEGEGGKPRRSRNRLRNLPPFTIIEKLSENRKMSDKSYNLEVQILGSINAENYEILY